MKQSVTDQLERFFEVNSINSVGRLSLILQLSRKARDKGLPLRIETTPGGGQVAGLSGSKTEKILLEYGISRKLSSEAGRTSRGSISLAKAFENLINSLDLGKEERDISKGLNEVEKFCIDQIQSFFDNEKIKIDIDPSMSISQFVAGVIDEATKRQTRIPGSTILGTVLQHMVGAKLSLSFPEYKIEHHPASACDESTERSGDFMLGETIIHVTSYPSPQLLKKCSLNLSAGLRPIIVCPFATVSGGIHLSRNIGISDRIEIFPAEQFISMNLNELGKFKSGNIRTQLKQFVDKYNLIVSECETDPSLQFEAS